MKQQPQREYQPHEWMALGDEFAQVLRERLTPEQWEDMIRFHAENPVVAYEDIDLIEFGMAESARRLGVDLYEEGTPRQRKEVAPLWQNAYVYARKTHLAQKVDAKPTFDLIRFVRLAAGLTQSEAAALIGKPMRTWQNWEAPAGTPEHRAMDAALWELFMIRMKAPSR